MTTNPLPEDWTYEATVSAVEKIVDRIESGQLELADLFEEFSTAVAYLRQCEEFLEQKQRQMELLIETLDEE